MTLVVGFLLGLGSPPLFVGLLLGLSGTTLVVRLLLAGVLRCLPVRIGLALISPEHLGTKERIVEVGRTWILLNELPDLTEVSGLLHARPGHCVRLTSVQEKLTADGNADFGALPIACPRYDVTVNTPEQCGYFNPRFIHALEQGRREGAVSCGLAIGGHSVGLGGVDNDHAFGLADPRQPSGRAEGTPGRTVLGSGELCGEGIVAARVQNHDAHRIARPHEDFLDLFDGDHFVAQTGLVLQRRRSGHKVVLALVLQRVPRKVEKCGIRTDRFALEGLQDLFPALLILQVEAGDHLEAQLLQFIRYVRGVVDRIGKSRNMNVFGDSDDESDAALSASGVGKSEPRHAQQHQNGSNQPV